MGKSAKNSPEVKIRIKSVIVSQEQCSISWFVVHLYKIMISPHLHAFFSFSKLWFFGLFGGGGGGKRQKWSKMTKNCLLHSIFQEPYIIWLSFMVHTCKVIISSGIIFIFSDFLFFELLGGWKGGKWSKMTKNYVCCTLYFRNRASYDCHLCYTFVNWYLQVFFF